ncbi:sorting nexin-17 isoform X2 [Agrilus planipennis]|uniref:Sorting nexin-17 isoform X2 n=1 Tax=Agrilus planipennis TaxID=224129 RepID=A0A7F5RCQ8_AGRPL|nr:sorting nexin-17 isoform X2 [Agrilus planipennis]
MMEMVQPTLLGFNIHINGVFHCSVRYRQLHNLHEQLKKEFSSELVPSFPPKKLLPLSGGQVEERRLLLEKYIQTLGQDPKLISSEIFVGFLLSAQQETACEKKQERTLDIYLLNNYHIPLKVLSTDRTRQVLTKACKHLNLPLLYIGYFSLFFIKREENGEITIIRKLQDFESPYISSKIYNDTSFRIVLRKSYWDSEYDNEIMKNPIALNLLYIQTVFDIEKGWIICNKDIKTELAQLQACLDKHSYIELARTLKYYGFIQFNPCYCDYPEPQTKVLLAAGGQELSLRIVGDGPFVKEGCFKVTRMRCWRITATHNKQNTAANSKCTGNPDLELSFEYLMSKDKLQWITITSEQAILMSVCLQSMVDELLIKKNGDSRKENTIKGNLVYMKRDGSSHSVCLDNPDVNPTQNHCNPSPKTQESFSIKKLQEKFSTVSFKSGREFVENHAFEGIGDDDL